MHYLPYILCMSMTSLFILLSFNDRLSKKKLTISDRSSISLAKVCQILSYLFYIIFSVFRSITPNTGGTDAWVYKSRFLNASNYNLFGYIRSEGFEVGFSSITWFFRQLTSDYRLPLLFWHTLTFILVYKFIKRICIAKVTKANFLVISIQMIVLFEQYNTLRQSVAISLGLYMLILLSDRKTVKAFFALMLSIFIHNSAFILLPVFIIFVIKEKIYFKNSKETILFFLLFTISISFISLPLLRIIILNSSKYRVYLNTTSGNLPIPTLIITSIIFVLSFIFYKKLVRLNRLNSVLVYSLLVFFMAVIFQSFIPIMYRSMLYFIPVSYAIIPSLLSVLSKRKPRNNWIHHFKFDTIVVLMLLLIYRIMYFYIFSIRHVGIPHVWYF